MSPFLLLQWQEAKYSERSCKLLSEIATTIISSVPQGFGLCSVSPVTSDMPATCALPKDDILWGFLRGANSKSLSTRWRTEQRGTARRWGRGPVRLCHQQPTTWDPHPTPCTPSTFIFLLLNHPTHPSTSYFPLCRPFSFSSTCVAPRPNRATELTS